MEVPNLKNNKIIAEVLQKLESFLGILYTVLFLAMLGSFAYFFSENLLSLDKPVPARQVPLSPEFAVLKSKTGIVFEGTESIKNNIEKLEDNTERIVGGVKGRANPFDSYAPTRPTR
jgi:hypothetical protein